jgi:hypothetical protein
MKKHAAPIIAAILLLLPVLYLGSYLALVVPKGITVFPPREGELQGGSTSRIGHTYYYRFKIGWGERVFWPLQQLHRTIRPDDWGDILIERALREKYGVSNSTSVPGANPQLSQPSACPASSCCRSRV